MTLRSAMAAAAAALTFIAGLSTAGVCAAGDAAMARRHHQHGRYAAQAPPLYQPPRPHAEARAPFSFYPNEIAGGVSGNPPFNNQIRKMKDPLNANGSGR